MVSLPNSKYLIILKSSKYFLVAGTICIFFCLLYFKIKRNWRLCVCVNLFFHRTWCGGASSEWFWAFDDPQSNNQAVQLDTDWLVVSSVEAKERRFKMTVIVFDCRDERSLVRNQKGMDDLYKWDKNNILNVTLKSLWK